MESRTFPRLRAHRRGEPNAADPIYGDDGPNVIHGDPDGANKIFGFGGDDVLYGGGADDVLKGGGGDDSLHGDVGADKLAGGAGDDTVFVRGSEVGAGDVWDGGKGRIDIINLDAADGPHAVDFTGVKIKGIERLFLSESSAVTITMTAKQFAGFGEIFLFGVEGDPPAHTIDLATGGKLDLRRAFTYFLPVLNLADADTVLDLRRLAYTGQVVNGGAGDDTIRASYVGLVLHGGGGDDRLYGGDGSDDLHGDTGYDTLSGGGGDDLLHMAAAGGGRFSGGDGYDRLLIDDGASAPDPVDLTASTIAADVEAIDSMGADLVLTARQFGGRSEVYAGDIALTTGGVIDVSALFGFFANHLQLADQATTLDFTGATFDYFGQTIDGGAGNDVVRTDGRVSRVDGGGGDDALTGGDGFGILVGGAGSDTVTGGDAVELLWGYLENSTGSDTGADVVHGGGGGDFLYINGGASAAYGDGGDDNLTVRMGASASFIADGGDGDDVMSIIVAPGDYAGSKIIGGEGLDIVYMSSADDAVDISAMEVSVERFFGPFNTTMTSAQLNGFEQMLADAHIVDGGDIDVSDLLFTTQNGNTSAFFLSALGNRFTAAGSTQYVLVFGGVGNDVIVGGDGRNELRGGGGDDHVVCASTKTIDQLSGGDGIDWIDYAGAAGAVTFDMNVYDQDTGGAGRDQVFGFENVVGSAWGDVLTGSAVANVIRGGAGADTVTGGGAADRFAFAALGDFAGGAALDRITDFSRAQGDLIDLSAIDPDAAKAGDQQFTFLGAAAFSGSAQKYEIRYEASPDGYLLVQGDVNHDQVADFTLRVDGATTLVKTDFVL